MTFGKPPLPREKVRAAQMWPLSAAAISGVVCQHMAETSAAA